jgi:hypothetical protein
MRQNNKDTLTLAHIVRILTTANINRGKTMPRKKLPPKKKFYVTSSGRVKPWIAKTLDEAIALFTERAFRSTTRNRNSMYHGCTIRLYYGPDKLIEHIGERLYKKTILAAMAAIEPSPDNPLDL